MRTGVIRSSELKESMSPSHHLTFKTEAVEVVRKWTEANNLGGILRLQGPVMKDLRDKIEKELYRLVRKR